MIPPTVFARLARCRWGTRPGFCRVGGRVSWPTLLAVGPATLAGAPGDSRWWRGAVPPLHALLPALGGVPLPALNSLSSCPARFRDPPLPVSERRGGVGRGSREGLVPAGLALRSGVVRFAEEEEERGTWDDSPVCNTRDCGAPICARCEYDWRVVAVSRHWRRRACLGTGGRWTSSAATGGGPRCPGCGP